jgi:MFS family permease
MPTAIAQRAPARAARPEAHARASMGPALTVLAAWLVLMCSANLASPLYAVYAKEFGFSSLVLTTIFAVYAVALIPSLMLFGQLSDRLGRRLVVTLGLAAGAAGLALFAVATGVMWLYAARAFQGLAVGITSGAATAALVELDPEGDRRRAALLAGLAQALGSGSGPLLAGVLAQWAPGPERLCFLLAVGATAVAAVLVWRLPEPGSPGGGWKLTMPSVPAEIRARFARVTLTAALVWAAAALFLSIVPSYASELLDTTNLALLGALAALVLFASAAAQVASRRGIDVRSSGPIGLGLLALGLLALVLAAPLASVAALVAGALLAGAGHGIGFLGAQDELNRIAPDEQRGEVTAAFITGIYALVGTSVIAVGVLDLRVSLSLAVAIVAGALAAAALAAAAWGCLQVLRPGSSRLTETREVRYERDERPCPPRRARGVRAQRTP